MTKPNEKLIITAERDESLLPKGSTVHNFMQVGPILLGCDYEREHAVDAFKNAVQIEIGGDGCKSMKHPLVVWKDDKHYSFFEADMDKVTAFEALQS